VRFVDLPPVYLDLRLPTSHGWLNGEVGEEWERGEREVMRRWVRPKDTVYDIGANQGFHTAHLSRLVGDEGRVYAFEPNPSLHRPLSETCRRLGNAELITFALAAERGTLKFFIPEDHTMASFNDWTGLAKKHVLVQVRRLDSLNLPAPDFIKCDVEGAELDVLTGGGELIDREDAPVILFEACAANAAAFGRGVGAVPELLSSLARPRYSFHVINHQDGSLSPLTHFDFNFANVLAIPALRRVC
jgi:FkbM family methyltransferase